ncbi:MAG: paraquat-inducible protein A [bacterium]
MTMAIEQHLATCHACGLLQRLPAGPGHPRAVCPRCGSEVHPRKTNSLQRTWALVVASLLLFFPANLLPIMEVTTLGTPQADTIMSGVMHLLEHGSWPLALVVFFASVVVPLFKIIALLVLLISVQRRSMWRPVERTRLYRLTELLGRWSMVDIFVVTVLAALVQAGALAEVRAMAGAVFFGAVVVVTMIAAESFDPRLIWDRLGKETPHHE